MPSSQGPGYGTTADIPRLLPVTGSGPGIIYEWAALLPLVLYLASGRLSYQLVGRTALAGFIGISVFPPLHALESIAQFLSESADFLDSACSISELRRTVWDANWGSVFPCANGAASNILTKAIIARVKPVDIRDYEKSPLYESEAPEATKVIVTEESKKPGVEYRRYQTLYILDCGLKEKSRLNAPQNRSTDLPPILELLLLLVLVGLSALAAMFGLLGSATCLLISFIFRSSQHLVHVRRPGSYLQNNETAPDGCMLVAIHENASTWYLYKGTRSVIDTLLNKPMIHSVASPIGAAYAYLLQFLSAVQIIAVTYVAAQKGWDGVVLLVLVCMAWAFDRICYSDKRLSRLWLQREGVHIRARGFKFGSRVAMIGAIQLLKENSVTSWMDQIICPAPRREAWLEKLNDPQSEKAIRLERKLSQGDREWLQLMYQQTRLAVEQIRSTRAEDGRAVLNC